MISAECTEHLSNYFQVCVMMQNLKLASTTNFLARWNKQNARANQINGRKAMTLKLLFQDPAQPISFLSNHLGDPAAHPPIYCPVHPHVQPLVSMPIFNSSVICRLFVDCVWLASIMLPRFPPCRMPQPRCGARSWTTSGQWAGTGQRGQKSCSHHGSYILAIHFQQRARDGQVA